MKIIYSKIQLYLKNLSGTSKHGQQITDNFGTSLNQMEMEKF